MLAESLSGLTSRSRAGDRTFYRAGVWHGTSTTCPTCAVAPGMLAAVMTRELDSDTARRQAIGTFDRMISQLSQPDGSFSVAARRRTRKRAADHPGGNAAGARLPRAGDSLPASTRDRWRDAVHRAAVWLEPVLDFYVNGNINMGMTTFMYLAWRVTGDAALLDAYRRSLDFTLAPGEGRWKGYGLQTTRQPQAPDWSDGRGFLAEAGKDGKPGFDPYYLTVQEAHAALLYAVSGSPRVGRVLNLLTNTLYARVNKRTWLYPTSGGSRRGAKGAVVPLLTPGAATLVMSGTRADLAALAIRQTQRVRLEFRGSVLQANQQEGVIAAFVAPLVATQRSAASLSSVQARRHSPIHRVKARHRSMIRGFSRGDRRL